MRCVKQLVKSFMSIQQTHTPFVARRTCHTQSDAITTTQNLLLLISSVAVAPRWNEIDDDRVPTATYCRWWLQIRTKKKKESRNRFSLVVEKKKEQKFVWDDNDVTQRKLFSTHNRERMCVRVIWYKFRCFFHTNKKWFWLLIRRKWRQQQESQRQHAANLIWNGISVCGVWCWSNGNSDSLASNVIV